MKVFDLINKLLQFDMDAEVIMPYNRAEDPVGPVFDADWTDVCGVEKKGEGQVLLLD
jgi:hypothetical protein